MARQYKIDVIVDDHGAVETLKRVSDAEDQVASGGSKLGTTLDTLSGKQRTTIADTRGMDEVFGRVKVSTVEADYALSNMHISASRLPSTFSQVRGGLNELAEGVGITVESLGMLGAAGLVVGTAITAWQVTRVISEFTGLDSAVDKTVRAVRDWGTGSQEAGAKADVLALASRRAGREITDFNEAVKVSSEWLVTWKLKAQEMNDAAARLDAPAKSRAEILAWGADIEKVRSAGVLPALTADIQSHNFSHGELAERYRISTGALGMFARGLQDLASWEKENHTLFLQLVKDSDDFTHGVAAATAKVREIELGGDHAYSTLHQWFSELARDQKYLNELSDQHIQKLIAEQQAAENFLKAELAAAQAQDAIYQKGARQGGISTPNDGSMERGPGVNQGATIPINGGVSIAPSQGFKLPGFSLRSYDVGGPIQQDGPIMAHRDEFIVPKDGALVRSGGPSATTIIHLSMSIDAKGASFENDRALDRLTDKVAARVGQRLSQLGG